ncbi:hypothetical protein LTR16_011057, partial [Cryomyces antarcticus]
RPSALLSLRRNRRQPRRAVPDRGGEYAAINLNQRPVHLHDLPAGDGARGGQVLRRQLLQQDLQHRRRQPRGRAELRRGPA